MTQYYYDQNGYMYFEDGSPVTDAQGHHVQHISGTQSPLPILLVILAVVAGFLVWNTFRKSDPGVVNPIVNPIQTMVPQGIPTFVVIDPYATPVINAISPTLQAPVVTIPELPTLPSVRLPRTGITPEGQIGSHNPGQVDVRTP